MSRLFNTLIGVFVIALAISAFNSLYGQDVYSATPVQTGEQVVDNTPFSGKSENYVSRSARENRGGMYGGMGMGMSRPVITPQEESLKENYNYGTDYLVAIDHVPESLRRYDRVICEYLRSKATISEFAELLGDDDINFDFILFEENGQNQIFKLSILTTYIDEKEVHDAKIIDRLIEKIQAIYSEEFELDHNEFRQTQDLLELRYMECQEQLDNYSHQIEEIIVNSDGLIFNDNAQEMMVNLNMDKQDIHINLETLSAKVKEISRRIEEKELQIRESIETDAILKEINTMLEHTMVTNEKLVQDGMVSDSQAREQILNFKLKAEERKEQLIRKTGGEAIRGWNHNLAEISVEIRMLEAKLTFTEHQLSQYKTIYANLGTRYKQLQMQLTIAQRRLERIILEKDEVSQLSMQLKKPSVRVIGAN